MMFAILIVKYKRIHFMCMVLMDHYLSSFLLLFAGISLFLHSDPLSQENYAGIFVYCS